MLSGVNRSLIEANKLRLITAINLEPPSLISGMINYTVRDIRNNVIGQAHTRQ